MDSENRPVVSNNVHGTTSQKPTTAHSIHSNKPHNHHSALNLLISLSIILVAVLLIVIILGTATYAWNHEVNSNKNVSTTAIEASQVNSSEYQSVFLTNGQVYFGKITVVTPTYIKLTDIYYLQVQQSVQPSTTSTQKTSTDSSNSNAQLVKLGNELHGPEDAMQIYRPQILFWENLKPSGKVSQAIAKYQSQ